MKSVRAPRSTLFGAALAASASERSKSELTLVLCVGSSRRYPCPVITSWVVIPHHACEPLNGVLGSGLDANLDTSFDALERANRIKVRSHASNPNNSLVRFQYSRPALNSDMLSELSCLYCKAAAI